MVRRRGQTATAASRVSRSMAAREAASAGIQATTLVPQVLATIQASFGGALKDLIEAPSLDLLRGREPHGVVQTAAQYLHARLPNSRLDLLDTGHFVWEEAPDRYGAIVAAWVTGGYLAGPFQ